MLLWGEWTGIGRAVWEVATRLSADPRGHEYVFYASRGFKRKRELAAPHFRVRRTWFSARNRTLRVFWEQLRLPRLSIGEVDVLHAPAYVMPLISLVPVVVTVHDTIALRHPELVRRASVSHMKRFLPKTLARAEIVLVPSRAVAKDLRKLAREFEREDRKRAKAGGGAPLKIDLEDKLRVVPFGVGPEFAPLEGGSAREEVRKGLGLEKPYVLFVGRVEPKKNLKRVVEAFFAAAMARKLPHDLVLVGPGARRAKKPLRRLIRELGITERVKLLGYVPDDEMPRLYAAAEAVLFPSVVEGFGFPLLEAMASGTPCVISRDEALRELAGKAALSVDAENLERVRAALERVLLERDTARELREKGIARAREFTWERTVDLTLEAYVEARERHEAKRPKG
jgi:glycosyltransferase involved in cell wall biosynthesis